MIIILIYATINYQFEILFVLQPFLKWQHFLLLAKHIYFPGLRFGYMIFSEEPKNGKMSIKIKQL